MRTYYKHRLFMGFCCVCCEVLYLCLYGLAFPALREARVASLVVTLPQQLLALEPGNNIFLLLSVFLQAGLPLSATEVG